MAKRCPVHKTLANGAHLVDSVVFEARPSSPSSVAEFGLELVAAGHINPVLDRALPSTEAAEAHRLIADNEVTGNLVLLPWS